MHCKDCMKKTNKQNISTTRNSQMVESKPVRPRDNNFNDLRCVGNI